MGNSSLPFKFHQLNTGRRALLLAALAVAAQGVTAQPIAGRVVGIADGDTLTLLQPTKVLLKVRLAGIDAPERRQPFGERSKQALADLVFDREVVVEALKIDRYGRTIGKVWIGQLDVGLEMLKVGLAWHYKAYEREQSQRDRQEYGDAQSSAKVRSLGLWQDSSPVPPWDFRRATNGNVVSE